MVEGVGDVFEVLAFREGRVHDDPVELGTRAEGYGCGREQEEISKH